MMLQGAPLTILALTVQRVRWLLAQAATLFAIVPAAAYRLRSKMARKHAQADR